MRVKSLVIHNIGLIADETVIFDKALILFYGEVKQGKTTILNCVRWVFGGPFPADIIRHEANEASIEIQFENGTLTRSFYRAPDSGEIKGRPLSLVIDGARVARPVDRLKALLNPFMLDQDYLVRMTELERKKYFAEVFNTATEELDAEAAKANTEASELRAKVKGYGDIVPVEVKRVDPTRLRVELQAAQERNRVSRTNHANLVSLAEARARDYAALQKDLKDYEADAVDIRAKITALENQLATCNEEIRAGRVWLADNVPPVPPASPPIEESTADLEEQISNAAANNVRAEQYERDKARHEQKLAEERRILELERRQREIRDTKIAKLDEIADASGIPGLEFREDGSFAYEDTTPGMLSTSQLMRLSAALAAKYPEGIGLDLIDRGESLGRSIFEFIESAKAGNKTVLATVVGERPATAPEEVGVFVVANGKISS